MLPPLTILFISYFQIFQMKKLKLESHERGEAQVLAELVS